MLDISIPQREINKMMRQVGAFELKKRREIMLLIEYTALQIKDTTQESLSQKGTGRIYTQGRTAGGRSRRTHQASSPGNPPALQTGRLMRSITVTLERIALAAEVGTNVEYAKWLEEGTVKMQARPFLKPAFDKHIPAFLAGLTKILSKA